MKRAVIFFLLLVGVVTANNRNAYNPVVGCVVQDSQIIENCCNLGYRYSTFGETFNKPAVYTIKNFCGNCQTIQRGYCDTLTDGGGWLVIQRRQDGSVDFNRNWSDYEDGFGSLTEEFWYGLRPLHCLTNHGQWELRIDYKLTGGLKGYLSYNNFRVGPATEQYPLTITGFDGATTNPFTYNNGMKFTTKDKDNDKWESHSCAVHPHYNGKIGGNSGGWWYNDCSLIYPNHRGYNIQLNGKWYSLPFIEIKIRPRNCNS